MLMLNLVNDVEDAEDQAAAVPRVQYPRQNPFEILSEDQFIRHFRLSKNVFEDLLGQLINLLQPPNRRRSALELRTKVSKLIHLFGCVLPQLSTRCLFYITI